METLEVVLPYPPSANRIWRKGKGGRIYLSSEAENFRKMAFWKLLEARAKDLPKSSAYSVLIVLFPADKRRRDVDNAVKETFDAITTSGLVWDDDSQVVYYTVAKGDLAQNASVYVAIENADDIPPADPTLYGVQEKQKKTPSKRTKKQ